MHEIDPKSEARLTEALRRLAAASPQAAPAELGAGLMTAFRRHHTRRRRIRQAGIAGVFLCLALVATLVSVGSQTRKQPEALKTPAVAPAKNAAGNPPAVVPVPAAIGSTQQRAAKQVLKPHRGGAPTAASRAFLALPGYDPTVPMDELNVVRVRLPESALWKLGAPVEATAGMRPMTADFVVSQDGTPYAVRLVNSSSKGE